MSVHLKILVNICIVSLLPFSNAVSAIYKCTDSEGNTTFSQLPCAKDEVSTMQKLFNSKSTPPEEDACFEAQSFSRHLLPKVQNEDNKGGDVIEELGGINNLRPAIISIINYVSLFRHDKTITPDSINSLTETKCKNAGFGHFVVDDFPNWRQTWQIIEEDPLIAPANMAPIDTKPPVENPSDDMKQAKDIRNKNRCNQVNRSLDNLRKIMRSGYTDSRGNALREQERKLSSQRSKYCQ